MSKGQSVFWLRHVPRDSSLLSDVLRTSAAAVPPDDCSTIRRCIIQNQEAWRICSISAMNRLICTAFICAASAAPALAQSPEIDYEAIRLTRIVTAIRITEGITLNGRLDEPAWKQAAPATDFFQKLPDNGTPASDRANGVKGPKLPAG